MFSIPGINGRGRGGVRIDLERRLKDVLSGTNRRRSSGFGPDLFLAVSVWSNSGGVLTEGPSYLMISVGLLLLIEDGSLSKFPESFFVDAI